MFKEVPAPSGFSRTTLESFWFLQLSGRRSKNPEGINLFLDLSLSLDQPVHLILGHGIGKQLVD